MHNANLHCPSTTTTHGDMRHYCGDHGHHAHAHAQVLFGLTGMLEVEVEGHLMCVDASAGLVVPAGARHGSSATRGGASVWVLDTPASPAFARVRPFAFDAGRLPALTTATRSTWQPWLDWAQSASRVLPRRRMEPASLERELATTLHEDWPTARMADHFALSVPQFHARWRALTGQTPQDWLRERRLNEAERRLQAGWSGEAAAMQVGYASASALLHALRRERSIGVRALRRR